MSRAIPLLPPLGLRGLLWGELITNDARCTLEIKFRIVTAKELNKKKNFHQQIGVKFKEETIEMLHMEHSFVWC
jgi:hypothetical protein